MMTAILIGKSYLDEHSGDVIAALEAHQDAAADILVAHINSSDPMLASKLSSVLDA